MKLEEHGEAFGDQKNTARIWLKFMLYWTDIQGDSRVI
jgi:hypothetical protein